MVRAPGGARRRAAGGRRAATAIGSRSGEAVRKGTWMAEEDAVLREHVRVHGPRDWSSIRSKGLLQRTGKSCRLRWVNKLRPNLKSGCKFSAEEERAVLDLQEKFGNKWARIATCLPGRTDNDVKNFWSTRQKRLARLMRLPRPGRSSKNLSAKKAAASSPTSQFAQTFSLDQVPFEGNSSSGQRPAATPSIDAQNAALDPYDQTGLQHLGSGGAFLPALPAPHIKACSSNAAPLLARTDNDVNNLWGTSQKPSGVFLPTPLLGQSSRNCSATTAAASSLQPPPAMVKGPFLEPVPFEGSSSGSQCRTGTAFMDALDSEQVPYDQTDSRLFGFGEAQPPVALATDIQAISSNAASLWPPQLQLYQPPYPLLDLPGLSSDIAPGFVSAGAMYGFACHQELLPLMQSSQMAVPFSGMHDGVKIEPRGPPTNHFDDLPPDMFDSADQLPPTSSPSRTISDR